MHIFDAPPRKGQWMQTFTGRQFWPLDPRSGEVHLVDIAHALSMQCRYAGHCIEYYSVAEHCVLLAQFVPKPLKPWALMHDASEAYLVDVPRPVKADLTGYRALEEGVMLAVAARFGLEWPMPAALHEFDDRIIGDERVNLSTCVADWTTVHDPLGITLHNWSPAEAKVQFLRMFAEVFP